MGDVTPVTGSPDRRRIRGERSRRAVAAAVAVAREHGLRVEEPTVPADLLSVMVHPRTGHRPDPEVLARCTELRTLQVVLCLIALYDVFGDLEGWDDGIRSMLTTLAAASRPGAGRWREAGAPSCACL